MVKRCCKNLKNNKLAVEFSSKMHTPKLFTILSQLEKEEWTSWSKMLKGQTQDGSDARQMVEIVHKNKNKLSEMGQAEDIQVRYFPERTAKYVSNLLSSLLSLTEDWIVLNQLEREAYQKELAMLRWYNERGLYQLANASAETIETGIVSKTGLSLVNPLVLWQLNYYQHFSHNNIKNETGPVLMEKMVHSFQEFVLNQSLVFLCELQNWGKIISQPFEAEVNILHQLLLADTRVQHRNFLYDLLSILKNHDVQTVCTLKERLFAGEIAKGETLHTIATIYVTRAFMKMNAAGFEVPKKFLIEMIEYGLETGVYSNHGKLSTYSFHNLVMTMSATLEYDIVCDFIEKWVVKVNSRNIESTKALAMAHNCFYHQKFKEILRYTWRSDFEFYHQKIMALCLHCIACFLSRNEEPDLYQSSYNSFKNTLLRNKEKTSEHEYRIYSNLIDFLKRCDEEDLAAIDLKNYDVIIFRSWCKDVLDGKYRI